MKKFALPILLIFMLSLIGCDENSFELQPSRVTISLFFHENEVIVDLYDNATAKDFASRLPMTLTFDDYNASEKTALLPNDDRLDVSDAPRGYDPSAGELGYYAPWGNIVIYHRDFTYAAGIVALGRFRAGAELFTAINGRVAVTFRLLTE